MVPTTTRDHKRPNFFVSLWLSGLLSFLFFSKYFHVLALATMDFCPNVSVSGYYQQQPKLDELFPAENTEEDVSLEWLSVFVEDCLTSTGNSLPSTIKEKLPKAPESLVLNRSPQSKRSASPSLQKFVVPSKARSKRKRATRIPKSQTNPLIIWSQNFNPRGQNLNLGSSESDPPLLSQGMWLADSELIIPKVEERSRNVATKGEAKEAVVKSKEQLGRRCSHCQAQRTPQWRAGPLGPKTLCNACGVRYKSGRLLPEYRPAKSPSFVSYLHSNSHKKVLEMRMGLLPSGHVEQ